MMKRFLVPAELLDEVERAFVHLDYSPDHKPEHSGNPQWHVVPEWAGEAGAGPEMVGTSQPTQEEG